MFGFSIDQRPDAPVGSPSTRRSVAIHWAWASEYTNEEIGEALGVTERTVEGYLEDGPGEEAREMLADVESEVRLVAVRELRDQLKAAGHRSRTAETPSEVWQDENGDVHVRDVENDAGETIKRVPVPEDIDLLPNEEARFYARQEVRDILDQLTDLLGVGEPEQVAVEHSGGVEAEHTLDDETREVVRDVLAARRGDSDE